MTAVTAAPIRVGTLDIRFHLKSSQTDGVVTLGKTKHLFVEGDRAYAVIPSAYDYKQNGKPVNQTDSAFTFALKKTADGWRIIAWSWAQN